jgi:hypothetical protein
MHPDSIAMVNPQFIPKLIFPTVIESILSATDWPTPELHGRPVYIQSASEAELPCRIDDDVDEVSTVHSITRNRVTPGERQ